MSFDNCGSVRILLIGSSGSGKTSLAHLIAEGKPLKTARTTVGCNAFVKAYQPSLSNGQIDSLAADQSYIIELLDVGAHDRYKALRHVFYWDINAVIVVYDSSLPRAQASVHRWAGEVAGQGTFVAVLTEAQTAANVGALPVPCLAVANKADLGGRPAGGKRKGLWTLTEGLWKFVALLRRSWSSQGILANEQEARSCPTIHASALQGQLDWQALDAFFREVILRRYSAGSRAVHTQACPAPLAPTLPGRAPGPQPALWNRQAPAPPATGMVGRMHSSDNGGRVDDDFDSLV